MTETSSTTILGPAFYDALAYAAKLHATQVRKGGNVPYIGHLLSVAGLVIEAGGTEAQVIAALLHDAAEDQGGEEQLQIIEQRFGEAPASIVAACSDTFEVKKPEWRERKETYLEHLNTTPDAVLLVSLADKLDNARAILRDYRQVGDLLWDRFNAKSAEDQLWYYNKLHATYEQRMDDAMVGELRRTLDELEQLVEASST